MKNFCFFCRTGKAAHIGVDQRCPTRNTHYKPKQYERNPRYKLTMVSVWHRGQRRTAFMHLPVLDGKVSLPDYNAFFDATGLYVPAGSTFSIGA